MGTWGVRALENDDAADWSDELQEVSDLSLVEETFEMVEVVGADYIEADVANEGLAACELIARLRGDSGYHSPDTERLDDWVAAHPIDVPAALVGRANGVIELIVSDVSELRELWEDSEQYSAWVDAIEDLRQRTTGLPRATSSMESRPVASAAPAPAPSSELEPISRTALEIAQRAVAAQMTADFGINAAHYSSGSAKEQGKALSGHQRMIDWMNREGIFVWLTPREREFFDSGLEEFNGDPDDPAVELESVGLLLWALGLADAPGASRPSGNGYHEVLHAAETDPDVAIVADSGLAPDDRRSRRSIEQFRVMADAYRLQLWRLDLVVRDKKARVNMREVGPELVGERADAALKLLSIYERNGDLIFDGASLVFYELYKRDIGVGVDPLSLTP